MSSMVL